MESLTKAGTDGGREGGLIVGLVAQQAWVGEFGTYGDYWYRI